MNSEAGFVVGQYTPISEYENYLRHLGGSHMNIRWFKVDLIKGPKPLDWRAPYWTNSWCLNASLVYKFNSLI